MNNYKENRPWGSFENLLEQTNTKVKILKIKPNQKLSLQSHKKREEHWIVVKGNPTITINKEKFIASYSQHILIPKNSMHRIENLTDNECEIIEIQTGDYFGEDDIKRFEDIYKRI